MDSFGNEDGGGVELKNLLALAAKKKHIWYIQEVLSDENSRQVLEETLTRSEFAYYKKLAESAAGSSVRPTPGSPIRGSQDSFIALNGRPGIRSGGVRSASPNHMQRKQQHAHAAAPRPSTSQGVTFTSGVGRPKAVPTSKRHLPEVLRRASSPTDPFGYPSPSHPSSPSLPTSSLPPRPRSISFEEDRHSPPVGPHEPPNLKKHGAPAMPNPIHKSQSNGKNGGDKVVNEELLEQFLAQHDVKRGAGSPRTMLIAVDRARTVRNVEQAAENRMDMIAELIMPAIVNTREPPAPMNAEFPSPKPGSMAQKEPSQQFPPQPLKTTSRGSIDLGPPSDRSVPNDDDSDSSFDEFDHLPRESLTPSKQRLRSRSPSTRRSSDDTCKCGAAAQLEEAMEKQAMMPAFFDRIREHLMEVDVLTRALRKLLDRKHKFGSATGSGSGKSKLDSDDDEDDFYYDEGTQTVRPKKPQPSSEELIAMYERPPLASVIGQARKEYMPVEVMNPVSPPEVLLEKTYHWLSKTKEYVLKTCQQVDQDSTSFGLQMKELRLRKLNMGVSLTWERTKSAKLLTEIKNIHARLEKYKEFVKQSGLEDPEEAAAKRAFEQMAHEKAAGGGGGGTESAEKGSLAALLQEQLFDKAVQTDMDPSQAAMEYYDQKLFGGVDEDVSSGSLHPLAGRAKLYFLQMPTGTFSLSAPTAGGGPSPPSTAVGSQKHSKLSEKLAAQRGKHTALNMHVEFRSAHEALNTEWQEHSKLAQTRNLAWTTAFLGSMWKAKLVADAMDDKFGVRRSSVPDFFMEYARQTVPPGSNFEEHFATTLNSILMHRQKSKLAAACVKFLSWEWLDRFMNLYEQGIQFVQALMAQRRAVATDILSAASQTIFLDIFAMKIILASVLGTQKYRIKGYTALSHIIHSFLSETAYTSPFTNDGSYGIAKVMAAQASDLLQSSKLAQKLRQLGFSTENEEENGDSGHSNVHHTGEKLPAAVISALPSSLHDLTKNVTKPPETLFSKVKQSCQILHATSVHEPPTTDFVIAQTVFNDEHIHMPHWDFLYYLVEWTTQMAESASGEDEDESQQVAMD